MIIWLITVTVKEIDMSEDNCLSAKKIKLKYKN
jgi:hypothetical protein